jgi:4-hydroxy-3-polyprenylbenzoate decarboxylase
MGKYIAGITGASGVVYAECFLRRLLKAGHEVVLTITKAGALVLKQELGLDITAMEERDAGRELEEFFGGQGLLSYYGIDNIGAPIASGSAASDGMIVLPCSMGSLSAIASGASGNLLERAADVMMKERRTLVIVPREAPYNSIHLENMLILSRCGVIVVPASPAFYQSPRTLEELVEFFVDRLLVLLDAKRAPDHPWKGISGQDGKRSNHGSIV